MFIDCVEGGGCSAQSKDGLSGPEFLLKFLKFLNETV